MWSALSPPDTEAEILNSAIYSPTYVVLELSGEVVDYSVNVIIFKKKIFSSDNSEFRNSEFRIV